MARFDYDLEGAYQFGTMGAGDIHAFMIASQIGYSRADWKGQPRLFLAGDLGEGVINPQHGKVLVTDQNGLGGRGR